MRLQKKVFGVIVGIQILFLILMSVTTNYKTIKAFDMIESRFFEQEMSRLQEAVDNDAKRLQSLVADWGAWDNMYSFMETKAIQRFDELLNGTILRALNVDFLAVMDNNMNPIVAYLVNDQGDEVPLTPLMTSQLRKIAPKLMKTDELLSSFEGDRSHLEFLKLGSEIYLFGSTPILTTNWTGPSRGMIVAGVNFESALKNITRALDLPCRFLPISSPGDLAHISGDVVIQEADGNNGGSATVWQKRGEVLGTSVPYALTFTSPRYIYNEGKRAVYNSYIWLFYNGMSLALLIMGFLSQIILKRVEYLRNLVDTINNDLQLDIQILPKKDDEIGDLAQSFNTLFDTLKHLLMDIPDALILCRQSGEVVLLNYQAQILMDRKNVTREEQQGPNPLLMSSLIATKGQEGKKSTLLQAMDPTTAQPVYEADLCCTDDRHVPVEVHQSSLVLGHQKLELYLARDLRERKLLEDRLNWKYCNDDYTGLPNRVSFVRELNALLKASKSEQFNKTITIVLINMDHFKSINADVGNANGDIVLVVMSYRIRNVLDGRGALYRTSGDEFSILFEEEKGKEMTADELKELLNNVRDSISLPYDVGDKTLYPSASMGVLPNALQYSEPSQIIEKATNALKNSKQSGLGVITFYKDEGVEMDSFFASNVLRMRFEIQEAVERDEFIPYFQPVYSIQDRTLRGFETLVRWQHPSRGFLTPGEFVPYAERIGNIGDIDQCMMRCAMKAIRKSPSPLYFSANGSSNLMQRPEAGELILSFLDKLQVDPSRFVLEVTESILIDNLEVVRRALNLLGGENIRIFLDDFGTGYSSLEYIHSLPFNCIKLDQAFVRRIFDSDKDAKMLQAIINMANTLGMDTVAEGVETEEQFTWLEEAGCKKVQGYLFAKPLPWDEANELILTEQEKQNAS